MEQADLELKADIEARGLLQNLVVTSAAKPKGSFAVEAGASRLRALQQLAEEGKIANTHDVCCFVLQGGPAEAQEASLAENFQRLSMNPADECLAFSALIEKGSEFVGEVPLILKLNNSEVLRDEQDPDQALTASVQDALRLGCCAVGFTIYPGSVHELAMYRQLRACAEEAKRSGLALVIWAYPRGSGMSKAGETAIDVIGYAVQIAAQLGAHIIKVKLPTDHVEQEAARTVYDKQRIPVDTLAERIRHVTDCAFAGRRIVIFSGGGMIADDETLLDEIRAIHAGGGFGSMIGRNTFQRPRKEALAMLDSMMGIYASAPAEA